MNVLIDENILQGWANTVREKTGTEEAMKPAVLLQKTQDEWGVSSGEGESTNLYRILVTPQSSTLFEFTNPLGVIPKCIFIEAPADSKTFTEKGYVRKAVISIENGLSVAAGINASTEKTTIATLSESQNENTESLATFYVDDKKIRIPRVQANVAWSIDTEYIVDIVGDIGNGISQYCVQNEVTGTGMVTCDYVNEHEHDIEVQLSSDTITDFSGVKVKAIGKNLWNADYARDKSNWVGSSINPGHIHLHVYVGKSDTIIKVSRSNIDIPTDLTVGCGIKYSDVSSIQEWLYNGSAGFNYSENQNKIVTKSEYIIFAVNTVAFDEFVEYINDYIQIEINSVATEYESYSEGIYTSNADGSVNGVKSISPLTHLFCDTDGVNITAKYYLSPTADYDRFWDIVQRCGERTDYSFAFNGIGWNDDSFKPKYIIKPILATNMFSNKCEISLINDENFDFSECTGATNLCYLNPQIKGVHIDISNITSFTGGFYYCSKLQNITLRNINSSCTFTNTFYNCISLINVIVSGTIGKSISFAQSSKLSNDSVQNIIDHLADLTGGTAQTLTLHANVKAAMTEEQKAQITSKNWTLA